MAVFDHKNFNGEVFGRYVDRVTDLKRNELLKAGVIETDDALAAKFPDQTGGYYATIPMYAPLGGSAVKYDGQTNISTTSRKTYTQSVVVVGKAAGWSEGDFASDVAGGTDFMPLAAEVQHFKENINQEQLLSTLKGIFSMTGTENLKFVNNHTYDITGQTTKTVGAATLNSAIQKACGDNKSIFTAAIMHSAVATNLENLQLLEYLKYTDANGVQRDLAMGTWNGRTVLIDDNMPTYEEVTTGGVYTITISTNAVSTDKIKIFGDTWTVGTDFNAGDSTGATATALKNALAAKTTAPYTSYTYSVTSSTVTITGKTGILVPPAPDAEKVSGTIVISYSKTSDPETATEYVTYVLGKGAIKEVNCPVKVAYEMDRDPATNGGVTMLYARQRKVYAPKGISFNKSNIICPDASDLENGGNWDLANDNDAGTKEYFPHKAIPICRIISRG